MKKFISTILTFSILLVSVLPSVGQKPRQGQKPIGTDHRMGAQFGQVQAFSEGKGSYIRWTMTSERMSLGYNIYRTVNSGSVLVNKDMIVGPGGHTDTEPTYGSSYSYFDPDGGVGSTYLIEWVGMNNEKIGSEQTNAVYTYDLKAAVGHSSEEMRRARAARKSDFDPRSLNMPFDLQREVESNQLVADPDNQRVIAAQAGVKIGIKSDGFYRVTKAELVNAGLDAASDPTKWQLYVNGVEQAIIVDPAGNYLEFVGKDNETIESDTRIYYLIVGSSAGKRMATRVSRPSGSTVLAKNYLQTSSKTQHKYYVYDIQNGDAENYWGDVITSSGVTIPFDLSGIDFTKRKFSMTINVQGFSTTAHVISISLNGHDCGTMSGSGQLPFSVDVGTLTNYLNEGSNALLLTSSASSPADQSLFSSIQVTYSRTFLATQNVVPFYTVNYQAATVTGFSSPNVRMFDTTVEGDASQLINLNIVPDGPVYDVKLPAARGRVMLGVEDSGIKQAASVTPNFASNLASAAHNAQLLIISHDSFLPQAEAWANYRRSQGFTAEVVDVADVYDEFNYGQASSASINTFLQYAYTNWQTPPQYVLLIGDGSYDPKNYEGYGYWNMVPSKIVNTVYIEVPSDEALADFNNDGLAEMAIGRIPARTPQDVTNALAKVTAFEAFTQPPLNRGGTFVYDMPIGYDFQAMSQSMRDQLPPDIPTAFVDRGAANSATTVINELNNGRFLVNYSGHGASGTWAALSFFSVYNVPSLTNANSQSVFTMLTCLNGYFIQPSADGLAETLFKSQTGGAVSVWASTGKTTPDIQLIMGLRFYGQITAGNIRRMGDLIKDAKATVPGGSDVRYSWALIGDPMLKIR